MNGIGMAIMRMVEMRIRRRYKKKKNTEYN
jgi:hypothetical protein